MKSRFQYIYSIFVLVGVLASSYFLINRDGNSRLPLKALQDNSFRNKASVVSPAVNQLFEIEQALSTKRKAPEFLEESNGEIAPPSLHGTE